MYEVLISPKGEILKQITRDADVKTYGVEIDKDSAAASTQVLDKVINSPIESMVISNDGFGMVYLNPPYDQAMLGYGDTTTYRKEFTELARNMYFALNNNSLTNPSVMVKEVVATIYFNNYWYEIAKDIYEKFYHETQDINFLLKAANSDFNLGNKTQCYQALTIAEKQILHNETVEDFQLLSTAYLHAREYDMALKYAHAAYKLGEKIQLFGNIMLGYICR